jgi:hypothetical protein
MVPVLQSRPADVASSLRRDGGYSLLDYELVPAPRQRGLTDLD